MSDLAGKNLIKFKKSLGQNFIFDKNLLDAIVSDAEVKGGDVVLEVGAGAGTLTARIADKAAKVVSVEIDRSLEPFLQGNLSGLGNVRLVFEDILKLSHHDILELINGDLGMTEGEKTGEFIVVANLPYYITTPVIFHFLESALPVGSMTITVQKEVALRMTAAPDTPDYGALTLAIKARADAKITRHIGRNMFTPPPNVDSAVVRIDIKRPYNPALSKVIKCLFAMRRKTIANNLMPAFGLSRAQAAEALNLAKIPENARGEQLGLEEVIRLSNALDSLK